MVAANEIELESLIILIIQPQTIPNRAHIWLKGYATVYCTGLPTFLGKNETKELNF